MILVDTNVWSELTRANPEPRVQQWEKANADRLWLATIVIGELLSGAHLLPEGHRKQNFLDGYGKLIAMHEHRIVPFDLESARQYGPVLAYLESNGRNPTTADAQLAGIALSRGMTLATRNTRDFVGLGLKLMNPWEA